jgi:ABC-2 type transport system ATP-binding protein
VVAEGTPAVVAARVGADQTLTFRPSGPVDARAIGALGSVGSVDLAPDGTVRVRGTGNVVQDLMVALAGAGVRPDDLRVRRSTLEDAFVSLTGAPSGADGDASDATPSATDRVEA